MKTLYPLSFLLVVGLYSSAQDICPCQASSYQLNQYTWSNSEEDTNLKAALAIPESSHPIYQLVIEEVPTQVQSVTAEPSLEKTIPETKEEKTVTRARPRAQFVREKIGGKRKNPRFKKRKRKNRKKYRGKCPKL